MKMNEKRVVAVVGGYIKNEVYHTIDQWMDEVGAGYNRHIYPWDNAGYQLFVVSNQPLDEDGDLIDATFNGDGDTKWVSIDEFTERPEGGIAKFTGHNYGGEWYTVGTIQGYNYDTDERYEC